ncbi:hypothetical protein DC415_23460 [Agrobacterium tumefaciens]|uniref:Uncharacterized protein n=1 Tax=Rhizobium rhizogenes TaxID=359 RepID=A0AA92C1I6_RHIRH|nr:hypothetical protein DC430_15505 [Rhizobium rhizogenes]PVE62064.1 hypothetical protein DC415_23460 [Agrobacterium tumefaciens]PVE69846.1 hypothetical protein DCP16_23460 [Sphingomonas sp. TPD3009]
MPDLPIETLKTRAQYLHEEAVLNRQVAGSYWFKAGPTLCTFSLWSELMSLLADVIRTSKRAAFSS